MSHVGVIIEILEYFPQNFNFDNFSFIFSSESKDFEREISFANKNPISQKIPFPKKNIRYSIKVTKNNSLVGISDFIIPQNIFSKRETSFDKICQITMTDSIRRLIFGSISPSNSIKICIHSTFQYLEKGEKFVQPAGSNPPAKREEKRSSTPKKYENNLKKMKLGGSSNSNLKLNKDEKKTMNKKLTEDFKKRSNSKSYMNNLSSSGISYNIKTKNSHPQNSKEIGQMISSNNKKEKIEYEEDKGDTSLIDEDLKNYNSPAPPEFFDFIKNFENNYPLEKLNEFSDPYEMMNYTKNVINELLNYQLNYYNLLSISVNLNRKFNDLLIKYNEKYI